MNEHPELASAMLATALFGTPSSSILRYETPRQFSPRKASYIFAAPLLARRNFSRFLAFSLKRRLPLAVIPGKPLSPNCPHWSWPWPPRHRTQSLPHFSAVRRVYGKAGCLGR
jgi:hypothetical protein